MPSRETKKFTAVTAILNMNDITVEQAERTFFAYKNHNIVLAGIFADDQWLVCDEYAKYTLDFDIDAKEFKELGSYLKLDMADFKNYLKTYVVSRMGMLVFSTLRNFLNDIRKLVSCPLDEIETVSLSYPKFVSDFFTMLAAEDRKTELDNVLHKIEAVVANNLVTDGSKQRSLASFESYYKFDEVIKQFWKECTDKDQKLFYFPVWLWWNLSAIIPMRPREFVLTPRDCLNKVAGKYELIIRKSKIKGAKKIKSYRIADDYTTMGIQIPDTLAKEIEWYQYCTRDFVGNELHTLFMMDSHYYKWERSFSYRNRYFTYVNLHTCLRYFFEEIVHNRYGYKILLEVLDGYQLKEDEIELLYLGDTRHLAMINMIASGATPVVAMVLAGHDRPDTSAHYYANIANLIECRVYRQYKKLIKGHQNYTLSRPVSTITVGNFLRLWDGSRCYSKRMQNSDFCDCYKACGPAGEIGYCKNCTYHREDGKVFTDSKDLYIDRIACECKNLADVIDKVRKGRGDTEEITQALLKIKDADYSYEQYLLETKGE